MLLDFMSEWDNLSGLPMILITQNWDINVLSDIYAEITEQFHFELEDEKGWLWSTKLKKKTYTISIEDNDVIASFKEIDDNTILRVKLAILPLNSAKSTGTFLV